MKVLHDSPILFELQLCEKTCLLEKLMVSYRNYSRELFLIFNILAVNSEMKGLLKNEFYVERRVLFSISNPNHPLSYVFGGNTASLRKNRTDTELAQRLQEHHSGYYSANLMALVVSSKNIPLDLLEQEVTKRFGTIPDLKTGL